MGDVYGLFKRSILYALLILIGAYIGTRYNIATVAIMISITVFINYIILTIFGIKMLNTRISEVIYKFIKPLSLTIFLFIISSLFQKLYFEWNECDNNSYNGVNIMDCIIISFV